MCSDVPTKPVKFCVSANAVKVSPKFDFGDTSPGISPDNTKISIGNDETSLNPGIVKAVLEVTVGEAVVTGKHPTKPDKKGDKSSTKTKILLCTLEGDCKIHEIGIGGNDSDEEEDGGKKKLKPVIVTGFNEDPLKGNENSDDNGKKNYNVPVIVGYRGAAKDNGFYYTGYGSGQSTDRLPSYYGMTPRPVFYQTYPGASTYENAPHLPSRPDFSHGSYRPTYPHNFDLRCVYPQYEHYYPDHVAARQYGHTSFPGYGPRTPSPYGKLHPTTKPDSFHAIITPIGRHNDRPTVYRPTNKPTEPGVVALHGKMNFDEDQVSVWGTGPLNPISGQGNIKVDGKLGEPLNKSAP
jgi:hypothetical protein